MTTCCLHPEFVETQDKYGLFFECVRCNFSTMERPQELMPLPGED